MKSQKTLCSEGSGAGIQWTEFDEATLMDLLKRRKAAGFRKPSRDVSKQRLQLGEITPNPNTVGASIVALVALKGQITRQELLDDMAMTEFPHRLAQPHNKKWCQAYVAGALRQCFLEVVDAELSSPSTVTDTRTQTPVWAGVSHLNLAQV